MHDDPHATNPEAPKVVPHPTDTHSSAAGSDAEEPGPPVRRTSRSTVVLVVVLALLAFSLAFEPVRTFASQVLNAFREPQAKTETISSSDLQEMGHALENGNSHVSLKGRLGDIWVYGKPGLYSSDATLTTLATAQSAVDFPLQVPRAVEGTQSVFLQPAASIRFKLNIPRTNRLLHNYGAPDFFSDSLKGKTFEIRMPPTVYVTYGPDKLSFIPVESEGDVTPNEDTPTVSPDPTSQDVFIVQTRGPQLIVPRGVDPVRLRDVLLSLPFLPKDISDRLSGVPDWQQANLVPNTSGSAQETTVSVYPAVVISAQSPNTPPDAANQSPVVVMWRQAEILRAVCTSSKDESLQIAESMVASQTTTPTP
jgi:hypothetical protein